MSATVHQLPSRNTGSQFVTKSQLARELGRSERWVEQRAAEGMPRAGLNRAGRRLFDLQVCREWLDARSEKLEAAVPVSQVERLESLERQVAELRAVVDQLKGAA